MGDAPLAIRESGQVVEFVDSARSLESIVKMRDAITAAMQAVMKEKIHYGLIPGCGKKPTLLQPGAQLLCTLFRLRPEYDIFGDDLPGGHKKYRVTCRLFVIGTEPPVIASEGVGECSSMESKHRFRKEEAAFEETGDAVPGKFWDIKRKDGAERAKEWLAVAYNGANVGPKKVGDDWHVVIWTTSGGEKVENANPTDVHNTILKIGKKRAYVDATITATASSDFFTQDLEDIAANLKAFTGKPVVADDPDDVSTGGEDQHDAPAATDFRETRIHFGKNRGLMLSELTPQQVYWYESDWLAKKEVNGATSVEDLALMNALKAYRAWRGSRLSPAPGQGGESPSGGSTPPATEKKPPAGLKWGEVKVHFGKLRGPLRGKKLSELAPTQRDYLRKEYDERAKADPDAKKLSRDDKKLKAALALEFAERQPQTTEPTAPEEKVAVATFNGPNHRALSESLAFANITEADFIAAGRALSWLQATEFSELADDVSARFSDDFGSVQDAVREYLAGQKTE